MRVAVLGCGHVSDLYFVGCRREPLELMACADLDLNRAEQKAAEHSVPRACSPEELLTDPDVDLVVNLTPPLAHADVSLAAIRAGKHVWSEKPLAATLEQAREVVEAADEAGVRVGCAPDTFLGGGLQTSMKLIDDGWIGEPVAGALCASEIGYEHFHPDVAAFYGPGGGPALDLGPYYVTAVVAMLGPIAHVTGFSRTTFSERTILTGPRRGQPIPVQVPTHVTGALELASGALVTVLMSWDVTSTRLPYLEVYGTAGSLSAGNPDLFDCAPQVRRAGEEELRLPPPAPGAVPWSPIPLAFDGDVGRGIGIADMAHAIRDERPHRASAELAFHVLEVLLALEAGGRVEIESRCERPPPLDRSAQSSDRRMAGQNDS
jgi:predicted dehydrogenase